MKKLFIVLCFVLVISSLFLQVETTSSKKAKLESIGIGDYLEISKASNDIELIPYLARNLDKVGYDKYSENNDLSFIEGLKNGYLVIASFFSEVIIGGICGYISGFYDKGIIMKIVWGFLGLIIIPIKIIFTSFFKTCILAFDLLIQKASITYYIGYIISLVTTGLIMLTLNDRVSDDYNEKASHNTPVRETPNL